MDLSQWQSISSDWRSSAEDAAWLMYSANYLLHTAGVRWALDPFWSTTRQGQPLPPGVAERLQGLDLVVLSHAHADHLDFNLLAALEQKPLQWVIPDHMLAQVVRHMAIPPKRLVIPVNGQPLRFGALTLTPFDGLHIHGTHGVPETGYLAEFNGKRWLFPGDTRDYQCKRLPEFGSLNGVFAHLWLGRSCAALPVPPLVEEFSRFFTALHARRVIVTHLYEAGRDVTDRWEERHYRLVHAAAAQLEPAIEFSMAVMGDRVDLF